MQTECPPHFLKESGPRLVSCSKGLISSAQSSQILTDVEGGTIPDEKGFAVRPIEGQSPVTGLIFLIRGHISMVLSGT